MDTETEAPPIGHNNPPADTPFDKAQEAISLLDVEASNWFDGAPIENEAQAGDVARILDAARKVWKEADAARKEEKKPHDDAAKAVQEKWNPLLSAADRIAECARKAQTKWLIKLDEAKRAEAERIRKEAEEKERAARELASQAAESGKLDDAKARDDAIKESQRAARDAAHADTDRARAKGAGMGRAIGLRTSYRAEVIDRRLLLNHIATTDADALTAFVTDWAQASVRSGRREIPGVNVVEERNAA
jgi:hypothetical protein